MKMMLDGTNRNDSENLLFVPRDKHHSENVVKSQQWRDEEEAATYKDGK